MIFPHCSLDWTLYSMLEMLKMRTAHSTLVNLCWSNKSKVFSQSSYHSMIKSRIKPQRHGITTMESSHDTTESRHNIMEYQSQKCNNNNKVLFIQRLSRAQGRFVVCQLGEVCVVSLDFNNILASFSEQFIAYCTVTSCFTS